MAGKLSNAGGAAAIKAALGVSPAVNRYLALATSAPTDSTLGSEIATVGTDGYNRQLAAFGSPTLVSGAEQSANTAIINFGPFSAAMGTATYVMLMDDPNATTADHMLAYASLDTALTPNSGDSIQFAVGALNWSVD